MRWMVVWLMQCNAEWVIDGVWMGHDVNWIGVQMSRLTAMQVCQGSVWSSRRNFCLIREEPTNVHLVLWTRGLDCEGLPMNGQVVQWTRHQGGQGHTYLGEMLLGYKGEWQ